MTEMSDLRMIFDLHKEMSRLRKTSMNVKELLNLLKTDDSLDANVTEMVNLRMIVD